VVPDDYHEVPTDYLSLVKKAVESGKPLLIVDEPSQALSAEEMGLVDRLLQDAVQRGAIVLEVNSRITENKVQL
jgi:ABC-type sugar transport system ATPase subunit